MVARDARLLVSIGVGAVGGMLSGWLTGMWETASLADGMAAAVVGGMVGSVAGGLARLGWRWLDT
jgi:hypothetical protein